MSKNKNRHQTKNKKINKINIVQLFFSVLAAFFGVQSNKTRERDFTIGKPIHYIMVGLIVVSLFILTLYGIVQLIMHYLVK